MWLQCEKERSEPQARFGELPWPGTETLNILADLNEQCLELLLEQAHCGDASGSAPLRELGELLPALDAPSRRRAATCPYLLVDAGFADPHRWRWASAPRVADREPVAGAAFFTVPGVTRLAHQIFNNAWYMARMQPVGVTLFLGMPAGCAALLRACTMRRLTDLAERQTSWLRPRWINRTPLWRELLMAAIAGEEPALERARLRGVQLLAGELYAHDSAVGLAAASAAASKVHAERPQAAKVM